MQYVHDHILTATSDTSPDAAYAAAMLRRTVCAAVALAAVAGCTTTPAWRRVELPPDFRPASLAAAGDRLLVGGRRDGAPMLVSVSAAATTGAFELEPNEPSAAEATLISVAAEGEAVNAIGRVHAGAHSNPRLTLWDGTLDSLRLTSRPQEFFTFGGHDAGNLLGIEVIGGAPVIFGLRSGPAGIEGVLWTRSGHTWTKHTELDPALLSNPDRVLGFGALARSGDRLVVAGDEVGLAGGFNQLPALWVGSTSGPWEQVLLPVPPDLPPVSGQLSRATGVACSEPAATCWVAGWVRGRPIVWTVPIGAGGTAGEPVAALLPGTPPSGRDPVALVTLAAGRPVVSTGAATAGLQLGCPGGWRALAPPAGQVSALEGGAAGLYLITGDRVERTDSPGC
ncbi:MAG: hypothetical protein IT193_18600 [Propionibacteriaceae bacterium]|nr:hypothetical protein [Propionibacteriaceae bacterium]